MSITPLHYFFKENGTQEKDLMPFVFSMLFDEFDSLITKYKERYLFMDVDEEVDLCVIETKQAITEKVKMFINRAIEYETTAFKYVYFYDLNNITQEQEWTAGAILDNLLTRKWPKNILTCDPYRFFDYKPWLATDITIGRLWYIANFTYINIVNFDMGTNIHYYDINNDKLDVKTDPYFNYEFSESFDEDDYDKFIDLRECANIIDLYNKDNNMYNVKYLKRLKKGKIPKVFL